MVLRALLPALGSTAPPWLDLWTMDRDPSEDDRRQMLLPPSEALGRPWEPLSWSSILERSRVPMVTEELAREALLSFVSSKCCYGRAAAGSLIIQELRQQTLCRYRLETFSESRISEWTFQPFTNHVVDSPHRGTLPKLWDIKVQVPPMFQEDTRKSQVPHSSLVKDCHKCCGHGRYKCSGCHGAGTVRCPACSGAKRKARPPRKCPMCSGSGRRRCSMCSGRGSKPCSTCKGERKLVHFVQLVTMWRNSLFEFVSEPHLDCPRELLAKAKGENLFKDENLAVYPIVDFPLRDISLASRRGILEHSTALASRGRILQQFSYRRFRKDYLPFVSKTITWIHFWRRRKIQSSSLAWFSRQLCERVFTPISQRQTIELVPLTEVRYWYQGKTSVYYVYGTDHQVYAAAYPARCCCSCTIV